MCHLSLVLRFSSVISWRDNSNDSECMVMKAALPCDNSKNEGKLSKNHIRAHYTEMEQCSPPVWLRFGVGTCVSWFAGAAAGSPPKSLAPALWSCHCPGDLLGPEEGEVILGLELSVGLGGYMCIKLWFISKAAFDKATLTLDSCGMCKSWFVRITR